MWYSVDGTLFFAMRFKNVILMSWFRFSHFDVSVSFQTSLRIIRVNVRYHLWPNEWKHYHFRYSLLSSIYIFKNTFILICFFFPAHKMCRTNVILRKCNSIKNEHFNLVGLVNPSVNGRCNKDNTNYFTNLFHKFDKFSNWSGKYIN